MTAIVGVVDRGRIWLGGDSAATDGTSLAIYSDPKVFIKGEFIYGYTSSFRMGQLIEHVFTAPTPEEKTAEINYMVKQFIPGLKECLKEGGYQSSHDGQDFGGTFLVGYRNSLYMIGSDYQIGRASQKYDACGCGRDLALGSLHTTAQFDISAERRIISALEAASNFSTAVRPPYTILSISTPTTA